MVNHDCEKQNVEWKEIWRDEYLNWVCGYVTQRAAYSKSDSFQALAGEMSFSDVLNAVKGMIKRYEQMKPENMTTKSGGANI